MDVLIDRRKYCAFVTTEYQAVLASHCEVKLRIILLNFPKRKRLIFNYTVASNAIELVYFVLMSKLRREHIIVSNLNNKWLNRILIFFKDFSLVSEGLNTSLNLSSLINEERMYRLRAVPFCQYRRLKNVYSSLPVNGVPYIKINLYEDCKTTPIRCFVGQNIYQNDLEKVQYFSLVNHYMSLFDVDVYYMHPREVICEVTKFLDPSIKILENLNSLIFASKLLPEFLCGFYSTILFDLQNRNGVEILRFTEYDDTKGIVEY